MQNRQGVDGYSGGEYDGVYWDHVGAAAFSLAICALLAVLYVLLDDPPVVLLLAAAALLMGLVESMYLSALWRRFRYLIWWRKLLIVLPLTPAFGLKVGVTGALLALAAAFGGNVGAPRRDQPPAVGEAGAPAEMTVEGLERNMAADRDGNVFEWNHWRGRWEPRPGFQGQGEWHVKKGVVDLSPTGAVFQEKVPDPYKSPRR